ncbi:MAG TPA: hypothetical protein VJM46_05115 [Candidatus Saccharimonadales bacterium]|nr:hypothetical protein [Candidatus Saccharimonadales bacterium]
MQLGTGYWLWAGIAMLAFGSGLFLWNALRATVTPFGRRINHLTWVLLALYPMGVGFKSAVIGPEFLRFHLSDIGFPVFVGFTLYHHFRSGFEKNNDRLGKDLLADTAQALRHRRVTLVIGLLLSYGYEVFTGLLYSPRPDLEPWLVGAFDWWDIANYTLGAALCYTLLRMWGQRVSVVQTEQAVADAAAEEERRKQRREERQRRQPKRRGRKGRRR